MVLNATFFHGGNNSASNRCYGPGCAMYMRCDCSSDFTCFCEVNFLKQWFIFFFKRRAVEGTEVEEKWECFLDDYCEVQWPITLRCFKQ